jgi:hypothetical protein
MMDSNVLKWRTNPIKTVSIKNVNITLTVSSHPRLVFRDDVNVPQILCDLTGDVGQVIFYLNVKPLIIT